MMPPIARQEDEYSPDSDPQDEPVEEEEESAEEEGGEATEDAPVEAPSSPVQPPNASARLTPLPDYFNPQRTAEAEALGISADALRFIGNIITDEVSARVARAEQSMASSVAMYEAGISGNASEYARVVGPKVKEQLTRLTPEQRADPKAVTVAQSMAMLAEAMETGEDLLTVATRHAELAGKATSQQPQQPRRAAAPVTSRVPTGTVTASSGRPNRPANTERALGIQTLVKHYGVSEAEARRMIDDDAISG